MKRFLLVMLSVYSITHTAARAEAPASLLPTPMPPRLLRTLAHEPDGYDPNRKRVATDLLLGDLLFHSPLTLGPRAQAMGLSCHACHPNGATHATLSLPGLSDRPGNVDLTTSHFRAGADDGISNGVNIPSLRGVRYSGPYGHDGRTASLAEFAQGVITQEFAGELLSPPRLAALVHYLQDLDFLPNRGLDARGRLVTRSKTVAASQSAVRGEKLFAMAREGFSGKSCASCHVPSSFFRDGQVHRIGSGNPASPYSFDDGYETPTLLNTAETAPYFHDGRFATLAAVVDWFNDSHALKMTASERADLTAYLTVVGATDQKTDDRPLGQRMVQTFTYLALLTDGESRDDRKIWTMVLEQVAQALSVGGPEPELLRARVANARERVASLRARCESGAALETLRGEVTVLHRELVRLAADWTGAL